MNLACIKHFISQQLALLPSWLVWRLCWCLCCAWSSWQSGCWGLTSVVWVGSQLLLSSHDDSRRLYRQLSDQNYCSVSFRSGSYLAFIEFLSWSYRISLLKAIGLYWPWTHSVPWSQSGAVLSARSSQLQSRLALCCRRGTSEIARGGRGLGPKTLPFAFPLHSFAGLLTSICLGNSAWWFWSTTPCALWLWPGSCMTQRHC